MRLDEHSKNSEAIKKSIREMNDVIERCVQANKLQDHKLQVFKAPIDLMQLLGDVVASAPSPERIELPFHQAIQINTDQQLLFIVLSNLLENACKYSAKETPILITYQDRGDLMQLSISNVPGRAGWPQEGMVFEKYYRSPGAQGQAGTGLGLFLVRSLASLLGGGIAYQPTVHRVCFSLTLPKS